MSRTEASSAKARPRKGGRLAPSRLFGSLWKRGATEAALLVTAAAVASGVVFGAGVARATSQTSDGQTWVSAADGTIVQINPVTGQPVSRIEIPLAGQVTVQQGNGVVLVTSASTGKAVSIDVGQVTASRSRDVDPATRKALLAPGGRTLIAELDTGVLRVVDSATMVDTGEAFVGPGPFVDVVVDKTSEVWALGADGTLTSVHYSDDAHRFITDGSKSLEGVDASSRMVPHPRGVTVLSPSRKALVQVGTGADVQTIVDGMDGEIQPAESSPRDLVAATLSGRKAVMILDGDRVWKADLSSAGCDEPGRPAVFGDRIYVPCAGQGRTLVLDRTGQPARDAIVTGGNDTPQIVGDDDSLVVTSATGGTTVTVDAQGRQHRSEIRSPSIPVVKAKRPDPSKAGGSVSASQTPSQPSEPSTPDPTSPPTEPDQPTSQDQQPPQQDPLPPTAEQPSNGVPPTPVLPSTGQPAGPDTTAQTTDGTALDGPRDVRAEAVGPGVATVSWVAPARRPDHYVVRTTDGAGSTQISGDAASASITVSGRGSAQFVVVADFGADGLVQSQPSNVVNWSAQTTTSTSTSTRTTPTRPGPSPDCSKPKPNAVVQSVLGGCPSTTSSGSSTRPTTPTSETSGRPSSGQPSSGGQPSSQTPTTPTLPSEPPTTPSVPTTPTTPTTPTVPTTPTTPTTPTEVPTTPTTPTTSEPPAPVAPGTPVNFQAYATGDGSTSNSVYVSWDVVAGVTYTMTLSKDGATPITVSPATPPYEKAYGPRMTGTVTITLYATQNGLNSESVSAQVDLVPIDICNPLRAGSGWLHGRPADCYCPSPQQPGVNCYIPLRGDTDWLRPDVVSAVPTSGSGGRIALAIALLTLAGGIHLTRVRTRRRSADLQPVPTGSLG